MHSSIEFGFITETKGDTPRYLNQVHSTTILPVLDNSHFEELRKNPPDADASITGGSNIELFSYTADCLPILLAPRDGQGPIAAIHSGWRGANQRIVDKTRQLIEIPASNLDVLVGPGIGPCCFEVKDDFLEAFCIEGHTPETYLKNGKFNLLQFVIDSQLSDIPKDQIDLSHHRCTYCTEPRLPSYRRDGSTEQRIRTWIRKIP